MTISEQNDKAMEKITNFMLNAIKTQKRLPWVKPWNCTGVPAMNYVSKRPYSGINAFIFGFMPFENPYFLTFKQIVALGKGMTKENRPSIKKGSKGIPVVFYKKLAYHNKKNISDSPSLIKSLQAKGETVYVSMLMKVYYVFNVQDVENYSFEFPEMIEAAKTMNNTINRNALCENIITEYSAKECSISIIKSDRAFYRLNGDTIVLPTREQFKDTNKFYSTAFHEIAHSTGHKDRLDRDTIRNFDGFGNHNYSKEELVAELSASLLGSKVGIFDTCKDNSAAYIQNWISKLTDKPEMLMEASREAVKAVGFIEKTTTEKEVETV